MLRFQILLVVCAVLLALAPQVGHAEWDPATYRHAQEYMLELINRQRGKKGLQPVVLDAPAGQVAKQHAEDMLRENFFSHWNTEGLKPTRRWNLMGGYDCVSENIYFSQGRRGNVESLVEEAMRTFMDSPGHRRTIMDPPHTHVGIGFAVDERSRSFYVNQTFVTRVGGDYKCPAAARPGDTVPLSGRYDTQRYRFGRVVVAYEELPRPRDRKWLDKQQSYSDASEFIGGYSPNPRERFRGGGGGGGVQLDEAAGAFQCDATLDHKGREGLYYLYIWLEELHSGRDVLAAVATVEVRK